MLDVTGYLSNSAPARLPLLTSPQRLADTRALGGGGPISSGASRCFQVAGRSGIPAGAPGVILNVTAVGYTTEGWLTVYPSGQTVPATSTLNFDRDAYAVANGALARPGPDGKVCVGVGTVNAAPGKAQVLLDASGYLTDMTNQVQLLSHPQRLVDTRTNGGPIVTGTSRCYALAGLGGIPNDAGGLLLNVAAASYAARGWLTLYPFGQSMLASQPGTSTLNFDPNEYAIANNAIPRVGSDGQVCVSVGTNDSAPGSSQVVLDGQGYLAPQTAGRLPSLPMLASSSDGNLFRIDPTGQDTPIGKVTSDGVALTDIARSEYGRLYGESSSTLYQIDPATGSITLTQTPPRLNKSARSSRPPYRTGRVGISCSPVTARCSQFSTAPRGATTFWYASIP